MEGFDEFGDLDAMNCVDDYNRFEEREIFNDRESDGDDPDPDDFDTFDMEAVERMWPEIEPNEDMDGDHASALASAGWGTDEDYGYFGGDDF